ncbi:MAG: hypothetical protein HKL89_00590 [Candidatus Dormibacteraeota bacterium]|nr:hypothetical protein [Candidatus Dormibacteraeota bacterium]
MQRLGGSLLEQLLDLDPGYRGPQVDCGSGHEAAFCGYRQKIVDTVLGPVHLRSAYSHCPECGHGLCPRDQELGVTDNSPSPGLRRMVARLGSQEPFAQGQWDLAELAGLHLTTKRVERSSEADGERVRAVIEQQAKEVLSGAVVPIGANEPVSKLYVAVDGTGVPTVPADTLRTSGQVS